LEKKRISAHKAFNDNLKEYLKSEKIKQYQLAEKIGVDKTTITKWKKDTVPHIDIVKKIAEYLDVTINDLLYGEEEKKKIRYLSDKIDKKILAQQSIEVKHYGRVFQMPLLPIISTIFICALVYLLSVVIPVSVFQFLITFSGIPLTFYFMNKTFTLKKIYIINYLDDVYYERESEKFKLNWLSIIANVSYVILGLFAIMIINEISDSGEVIQAVSIAILIWLLALFSNAVILFANFKLKFNKEIYDNEIGLYNASRMKISLSMTYLAFILLIRNLMVSNFWNFLYLGLMLLAISIIDFFIISLEFSKYKLVYKEDGLDSVELYQDKN